MPCYVTGSAAGDLALSLEEAHRTATTTTEMLCWMCARFYDYEHTWPENIRKWWKKHMEIDRKRGD